MGDGMMEDFIDDFLENESKLEAEEDEIVIAQEVNEVEATPFIIEENIVRPNSQSLKDDYKSLSIEIKRTIDEYLKENSSLYALKYEIDNNKILIQDLKSSVVSLKVSTSRIEKEVKDLGNGIGSISHEKNQLDNCLVDLEFRFNELVTRQEEGEMNNNSGGESPVNQSQQPMIVQHDEELQSTIKDVVENLESKIKQLDQRIITIDDQNRRIVNLSEDIAKHEKYVKDIKDTLNVHAEDLTNLDNLTKKVASRSNESPVLKEVASNGSTAHMVQMINEFIAKTEHNEKSIATAWVGLIAALLLIPIAYFFGRIM